MIVLDTNVISELQGRQHSERILRWLDGYDREAVFLTAIATAEMHFGIALLEPGARQDNLRQTLLRIEKCVLRTNPELFANRCRAIRGHCRATPEGGKSDGNQGRHDRRHLPVA